MSSAAAGSYRQLFLRSIVFRQHAARLRGKSDTRQLLLHASLATSVAAWDQYVRLICMEALSKVNRSADVGYQTLHLRALAQLDIRLSKFNTPNFDNSRNLILETIGFDTYNYWSWSKRAWPVVAVRNRLNEILKVRHSFAHGSQIPKYSWNTDSMGNVLLSSKCIRETSAFLNHLAKSTDRELRKYIEMTFDVRRVW